MLRLKPQNDIFKSSSKFFCYFFLIIFLHIHIKMSKNLSTKYYQENKERLQKKLNLSKEGKLKKWQYGCDGYKNLLEAEK